MKALVIVSFIIVFLTSCGLFVDSLKPSISRISNESDYDVKILPFSKGTLMSIINQDTIKISRKSHVEKINLPRDVEPFFSYADSIVVLFENKKILIQYCQGLPLFSVRDSLRCNVINNLVSENTSKTEHFSRGKYSYMKTHYITNEDYFRAKLLNE